MTRIPYLLPIVLVFGAIVAGGYLWWMRQQATDDVPAERTAATAPSPAAAAAPASEPAIRHPVAAASQPVPEVDASDSAIAAALDDLVGSKAVLTFLQTDGFVRRVVATVDNLGRAHAAPRLWPVNPTPGRFGVSGSGDERLVAPDNDKRYAPFVEFVEAIDARRAVELYVRLYPRFQQSYEDLGYPGRYFNDRLVEVIDLLLETPEPGVPLAILSVEVMGPEAPKRPWVNYEFADPSLEALAAGQKMLLRTGPHNERRLKAKLREFRREIVAATPPR